MKNKRILIDGKSYFIDLRANNIASANLLREAHLSGDEEWILRVASAVMVMALGLPAFLSIPIEQLPVFTEKIMRTLTGQEADVRD